MKEKFLLIASLVLFASLDIQAQLQKGDWLLGGAVGFYVDNSTSTSNAGIAPHIGLSIGRNSFIGFRTDIYYNSTSAENSNFSFSINLLYRTYYVLKNKLGWYLENQFGAGWSENKSNFVDNAGAVITTKYTTQYYDINTIPGIYYQVSPGILLNADCGGMRYTYSNLGNGSWASSFRFDLLNSFTFGVDFILGKRKI